MSVIPPALVTVYAELRISTHSASGGDDGEYVIAHAATAPSDRTLCHLPLRHFQPYPDLAFSPRPAGMDRCASCLAAYALLSSSGHGAQPGS